MTANALRTLAAFFLQVASHLDSADAPKGQARRLTTTAAAALLGVTREHLSRVLHGHRESRSLRRRYEALHSKHHTL